MSDYLRWILFSVILSLSHLFIAIIVLRVYVKKVKFKEIIKDGSLLFFAMCLTSTSFADFLASDSKIYESWLTLACFGMIVIVLLSVGVYALLIKSKFASFGDDTVDITFVSNLSVAMSIGAVLYSSTLFFITV